MRDEILNTFWSLVFLGFRLGFSLNNCQAGKTSSTISISIIIILKAYANAFYTHEIHQHHHHLHHHHRPDPSIHNPNVCEIFSVRRLRGFRQVVQHVQEHVAVGIN